MVYSWYHVGNTQPLQSQGQNSNSNTFTIHRATPRDEGVYYCVARKNEIRVQSNSALVQVNGKEIPAV